MDNDTTRAVYVAHDEHLLTLLRARYDAHTRLGSQMGDLWHLTGVRPARNGLRFHADTGKLYTHTEAVKNARQIAAGATPKPLVFTGWDVAKMVADYDAARDAATEADGAVTDHEANYTGWNRYFLVVSSAGHVHRSMHCSTCRPATRFAPLPHLSGLADSDAVNLLGETLCTVCFPTAPVTGKPLKFPQRQAERLLVDGEEAFLAALAEARAKQEAAAAERCPGSGTHDHDSAGTALYRKWARCNHCGESVSVTSTFKLRQHKAVKP